MATASQALSLGLCAYPAAGHTDSATPKRPFGKWRDYQTRRPTDAQLTQLYAHNRLTTVGLICGAISDGLECLDFDTKDGYQRFRAVVTTSGLAPVFQRIEAGYSEQSPKGIHLLYFCEVVDGSKKLNEQLKIETRGEGGYVVVAPSTLPQGDTTKRYQLISGGLDSIARISRADREALHALIRDLNVLQPNLAQASGQPSQGLKIPEGGRNSMLTSLAGKMRHRDMSDAALAAALHAENKARCNPPLPDAEVMAIVRSVTKYPAGQSVPPSVPAAWQSPKALPTGIPSVHPLDPVHLLPQDLGDWVTDHAHRLQCPTDYPAVAIVVALSSVIGGRIHIRPKQLDNWTVTPNLWGVVIGRPSTLKSPAMSAALAPLTELEAAAEATYKAALTQYEVARMAYELALGNAKRQANKNGGTVNTSQIAASMASVVQQQPSKPARQRFIVNDATVEKLGEILAENQNGVLLFRDELKGFLAELDGEENATKRAFILQAWAGDGSYDFDRIGRGHIHIPRTILSVLGTTQPGVIEAYLATALRGGVGDDGLMQRFQLAVYPDEPDQRDLVDALPNLQAANNISALFRQLAQLNPSAIGAQQDNLDGVWYLRFSPEAQQIFNAWYPKLIRHTRTAEHAAIASHYGKYRSLVPSLALIFHLAAGHTGPVDQNSLLLALAWASYLKSHALRIYNYSIRGDARAAGALGEAIMAGKLGDGFSLREVQRKNWSSLSSHERCTQAIEILAEHHWLTVVRSESNGKTTERCLINPTLLAPRQTQ